jgi:chemotaxis protein methyltransferase CheR
MARGDRTAARIQAIEIPERNSIIRKRVLSLEAVSGMEENLDFVLAELKKVRGVDLSGYRRAVLHRRLAARMSRVGDRGFAAYIERLRNDPEEYDRLIEAVAVNVSSFFRNPLVFEILAKQIVPEIIDRKERQGSREVRAWSAGCAQGEEAYSIAILLHRALCGENPPWTAMIFATDIDGEALAAARRAVYAREKLASVKLEIVDRYFKKEGDGYALEPGVRDWVHFSRDDLLSGDHDSPRESVFGSFDLVMCRNVLIYLSRHVQETVLHRLTGTLAPGGYLVLGAAESLTPDIEVGQQAVDGRNRIYRKPPG